MTLIESKLQSLKTYYSNVYVPLLVCACWMTLPVIPAGGQEQAEPPVNGAPEQVTLEQVEADLAKMEEDTSLDDTVKELLRPKYEQAIELLKQAGKIEAQAADYRKAPSTAPASTEQFQSELENLPTVEQAAQITAPTETDALQKEIESRKAALSQLNEQLSQVKTELTRVRSRPGEIGERLNAAQRELTETNAQLESPEFSGDVTSPGRVADKVVLQAQQAKLRGEVEMLKQEQASQSVRAGMLQSHQELLSRQIENADAALKSLSKVYEQRLENEADRIRSLAEEISNDLPKDDESVQSLVTGVQSWADEFEQVVANLKSVRNATQRTKNRRESLTDEYESIQQQVNLGGGGRILTRYLLNLRRSLPEANLDAVTLRTDLPKIDETRLQTLEIDRAIREQADIERQFADHPSEAVNQLVKIRGELLDRMRTENRNLNDAQSDLQLERQEYVNKVEEIQDFIAQQIFWRQSSPPIEIATFTELPEGLQWELQSAHWEEVGQGLLHAMEQAPVRCITWAVLLLSLLVFRGRIAAALQETGAKIRRISTDKYSYTLFALLWTCLLALPLPLMVGFLSWGLGYALSPSEWMRGVRAGLQILTIGIGTVSFFIEAFRPGGLGEVHFRWPKEILHSLRSALAGMTLVYVPALLLATGSALGDHLDSVGRVSLVVVHVWLAFVIWRLFRAPQGILASMDQEKHPRRLARWQRVWFPLLLALPLALAALAIAGFVTTAFQLSIEFIATAGLIAGAEIVFSLVLRWFSIKQRRLALNEALEKRRARQEALESGQHENPEVINIDAEDEEELDLQAVSDQTKHVLRLLSNVLVAIAVILLWSGSIQILEFLDTVRLPFLGRLTLRELCELVLVVIITVSVVRNLPGLLELTVLRATKMKAGTRIAVSTLAQYAVIAVGVTWALSILQVDWAAFGWIAAALSVGIGFGLQEVVANFVSGLILLFERPIRVGDIVTVEETTGTVTRIHMRATTITNWERQEFIVPNRNLITNTILNWTLSSSTNRVTIVVGVAYGSDTDLARQILLEVAEEHPLVLKDPAPMSTFEEFADSALTLRLRAFLPDMDNRLSVVTELHTEIDRRFAEAGLEIAFPQRDLHIRTPWPEVRPAELQTFAESD